MLGVVWLAAAAAAAAAAEAAYAPAAPLASVRNGAVRGAERASRGGRRYDAFTGVPYARAPVGELRFKNPEPYDEMWHFPWDATKPSPVCIQKNYFFVNPAVEGKEDCLYLNVYVPKCENGHGEKKSGLPVMVFIHWGAFFAGRGTPDYLGPEYFMDKDVILVTFNYRLGPFGFLTTSDDSAPGNYGLKDQVLALRWVQENIENFGGNKQRVTIFGQSAGGGSVHYHLLSPLSRGLFHQAISQSGSALAVWAKLLNDVQKNVTLAQAQILGCKELTNNEKLIECLRNVDAADILSAQDYLKTFSIDPLIIFTPVKEKKTELNSEPFFTKEPLEYIKDQEFYNVPWIVGTVQNEGDLRVEALIRQSQTLENLNKNFSTLLPALLGLQLSTADSKQIYKDIVEEYLHGKEYIDVSNPGSIQRLLELYGNRAFHYPMYQSVMLHSAVGHKPIWVYSFEYKGQYSYGNWFAATNETVDFDWGASHCDDLLYLFRSPGLFPDLKNKNDIRMSHLLINIWTNFAIHGTPQFSNYAKARSPWTQLEINSLDDMKNENVKLLNISGSSEDGISVKFQTGFKKRQMAFWSEKNLFENFKGLH